MNQAQNTGDYRLAGWAAIANAVAFLPEYFMSIMLQRNASTGGVLLVSFLIISLLKTGFALYALQRFGQFLIECFDFDAAQSLIRLLIAGNALLFVVGSVVRLSGEHLSPVLAASSLMVVGLPLGVVSVLFGLRILKLEVNLNGYKKPYAYLHVLAPICFLSMVLAPLGWLMLAAASVFLALIFFRGRDEIPEFV